MNKKSNKKIFYYRLNYPFKIIISFPKLTKDGYLYSKDIYNKIKLSWIKITCRHFIDREWHGTVGRNAGT